MRQHFIMFAAYNRWANEQVYEAAAKLSPEELTRDTGVFFKSVMGTLNHLLGTDRIWMKRFTGEGESPATLDAILHFDFKPLSEARKAEDLRILDWVSSLNEEALAGQFTYKPVSDIRSISQRLAPALSHLFNHQTHHRGQVHSCLTILGQPSIRLDLIYFQRLDEGGVYA